MKILTFIGFLVAASMASAELTMPNVFGDHMVLQGGKPVKLWGKAEANAKISVEFAGKKVDATAQADGAWEAQLPQLEVSAKGAELKVTDGTATLVFKDVLVGEVWHASGQSNMQWSLKQIGDQGAEAIAAADIPQIRFFQAKHITAADPQWDVEGKWVVSSPDEASKFSAVGYFFARKLHRELGVPVGVVQTAWGGKPVETYTRRAALESIPIGKEKMEAHDKAVAAYDEAKATANHKAAVAKYQEAKAKWDALPKDQRKGKGPRQPRMPQNPALVAGRPATIWNGMVAPVAGYTQRGAIWYQGESNRGNADEYGELFSLMIRDWRKVWGDDFTFLWVQLANWQAPVKEPGTNDGWAVVQEHQRRCLTLPKTGMAVINDIGDAKDIHPRNKKDVGERLARWALADDYGKNVLKCGPLYKGHAIADDKVTVNFDYVADGLKSRDGDLQRFEIQDQEGKWYWADAKIDGNAVVLSHANVKAPKAVRYAWAANPEGANLINSEGLPASCFTTEW